MLTINPSLLEKIVLMFSLSIWGGCVCYLTKSSDGEFFSIKKFISSETISTFTGVVSGLMCIDANLSELTCICVSAIAASVGPGLLEQIQLRVISIFKQSP